MIPSALSSELQQGMADFLRASFWSNVPGFDRLIDDLIETPGGLMRGPYLSLKLPFKRGAVGPEFFEQVPMAWPPHAHQERGFERLSGETLQHTLVATGTGSGKTETFLIPILAECARRVGTRGIKAILIYPMNALATDQARRLAGLIDGNPHLKGKVTAGLFVGQREESPHTTMGASHLITDRKVIADNPPDILLTNYKMLDYLLMRPRDQRLWRDNGPETLRFVVVDEIHTFDGAQGTDLACLLRRLKSRLAVREGSLCCVGTSATLGGPEAAEELLEYASRVFGERFERDAIVGEQRLTVGEFLAGQFPEHLAYPTSPDALPRMLPERYSDTASYVRAQARLWFEGAADEGLEEMDTAWRVRLGDEIKKHVFFQQLVGALEGGVKEIRALVEAFRARLSQFRALSDEHAEALIASFVALISVALREVPETAAQRAEREAAGRARGTLPFVQVQVQLWQRELRRMVATVEEAPRLRYYDDLTGEQSQQHLPVVYCPTCGLMGWASKTSKDRARDLSIDLRDFYASFFSGDDRITLLYPESAVAGQEWVVNPTTLRRDRAHEGEEVPPGCVKVTTPGNTKKQGDRDVLTRDCPRCGAHESLTLLGFRAATLTSAFINQLAASRFNDDKKLLTFSDSVQDAAHRAGFFGARTWRLNLRVALQQALEAHGEAPRLSDVADVFMAHWSDRLSPEELVATFLPPNLEHSTRFGRLKATGRLSEVDAEALTRWIKGRVEWEVHLEYGMNTRIGRSLPRSLSSVAGFDEERLERAVEALLPRLQNEVGGFREVTAGEARGFLLGIGQHLQEQGGIDTPGLPTDYIESGGKNTWLINKAPHLPSYGRRSRLPVFVTFGRSRTRLEPLLKKLPKSPSARWRGSWYQQWYGRVFGEAAPLMSGDAEHVYRLAFEALREAGLAIRWSASGDDVYGLTGEGLRVTPNVAQVRCATCHAPLPVSEGQAPLWEGERCVRSDCDGRYARSEALDAPLRSFRRMYRRGDVHRVVTAEHTGLLGRDARQELEERFKAAESRPWEPNLLSCTPTLEMGIDIGALSTAIMCSVPPAQANYLQRVGRAGRRDGNALILTLAGGRAHDLYFYSEPEEMIAGAVKPPGVYLSASAVLERQLTAYCVDRWVHAHPNQATLPGQLKEVFTTLEAATKGKTDQLGFPYDLLNHIEAHQTELLASFLGMFTPEETGPEARAHLRVFMEGDEAREGSLRWKILNGLMERQREYKALYGQIPKLSRRLRKLKQIAVKDEHTEQEIKELEREQEALRQLARSLRRVSVLECLTDEGLLPNYAFPESGVTLRSVISRRKEGAAPEAKGKDAFERVTYEYMRPAASALSELAPGNHFYADGYRVRIEKIDMAVNPIEPWRFCDRCDCAMPLAQARDMKTCPMCGSPYWSDASQRRDMLKLRQVFAWSPDSRARIGDESDERTPTFYNKQMLVLVDERGDQNGWVVDDAEAPFGFEYIRRAVLREVNFGEHTDRGLKLTVGGQSSVRQGFTLCGKCGMVQKSYVRRDEPEEQHDYTCPARGNTDGATLVDCLYLYREVRSEAVRILMPFLEDDGDDGTRQHSFIAALQMGMADFFGGSIDHLRVTTTSEPLPDQSVRKQFLLLYDTIPGGTGYLKELVRAPDKVFELLSGALARLKSCACNQDPDKDGCYRCLFAYRNSYDMKATSRNTAIDLLTGIVAQRDQVRETPTLGEVEVNAMFDSVLEARFIESLRRVEAGRDRVRPQVSKDVVEDVTGYLVRIGDQRWKVQPQVDLGPEQGVDVRCRPDFVFWPARSDDPRLPVAVFTDGFGFHKDRVGDDFRKRMAIVRSGRFVVWSLSWDDVDDVLKGRATQSALPLFGESKGIQKLIQVLAAKLKATDLTSQLDLCSHALLMSWLADPKAPQRHPMLALLPTAAALLSQKRTGDAIAAWPETLRAQVGDEVALFMSEHSDVGASLHGRHLSLYALASREGAARLKTTEISVACCLDDAPAVRDAPTFKADWLDALRLLNLLQFLPRFVFVTLAPPDAHAPAPEVVPVEPKPEPAAAPTQAESAEEAEVWSELIRFGDGYVPLLEALRDAGCDAPLQGFEPVNDRGHPEGLAELAWVERQVAVLFEEDDPAPFERRGWTILMFAALEDDPSAVQTLIEAVGGAPS